MQKILTNMLGLSNFHIQCMPLINNFLEPAYVLRNVMYVLLTNLCENAHNSVLGEVSLGPGIEPSVAREALRGPLVQSHEDLEGAGSRRIHVMATVKTCSTTGGHTTTDWFGLEVPVETFILFTFLDTGTTDLDGL